MEACEVEEEELKLNNLPVSSYVKESKLLKERGNVKNGRLLPKSKQTMPLTELNPLLLK